MKIIVRRSSDELYNGKLTAHASVAGHDLKGLMMAPAPASPPPPPPVLLLVDTAGCGFEERQEEEGDSRSNEGEARAVMAHVERLVAAGVPAASIGIITPYNAQVERGVEAACQ